MPHRNAPRAAAVRRPPPRAVVRGTPMPGRRPRGARRRRRDARARHTLALAAVAMGVILTVGAVALFAPGLGLLSRTGTTVAGGAGPAGTTGTSGVTSPAGTTPARQVTPPTSPTPPPLPQLRFKANTVSVQTNGFVSWALMDRRTGEIWGSANFSATTWPASMIKGWIAADYLRRTTEDGEQPSDSRLDEITTMIRESDNDAAEDLFDLVGRNASITRLINLCKLTDTTIDSRGWGFVNISARDSVRMADCIADGTAAGTQWTNWLLERMRTVTVGDFGIRNALPKAEAADVAIKNGWLAYDEDEMWHVNCMAVAGTWAMAVLQRYTPTDTYDFGYGEDTCQSVASQLLNPNYVAPA